MTDEQINKRIATIQYGWTEFDVLSLTTGGNARLMGASVGEDNWNLVPNYADDLNAIVGVCREHSDEIKAPIAAALTVIVMRWSGGQPDLSEREDVENYRDFFDIMAATPRQWCEAFLRVKGQWEEPE